MIGGKVVDPSALAAYVRGSIAMDAWMAVAAQMGMVLYLPALAVAEVRGDVAARWSDSESHAA